jgi:hypothetical protein
MYVAEHEFKENDYGHIIIADLDFIGKPKLVLL